MSKAINRLNKILEAIEDIDFIINDSDLKITQAINDKIIKPAIITPPIKYSNIML